MHGWNESLQRKAANAYCAPAARPGHPVKANVRGALKGKAVLTMDFSKYMREAMTVVNTMYALRWVR